MKHFFLAIFLLFLFLKSHAAGPAMAEPKKEPSYMDLWNGLVKDAQQAAGIIKNYGRPRSVKHGATPELILNDGEIRFNNRLLRLGAPLDEWTEILGRNHRDDSYGRRVTWDDLGIELAIDDKDNKTVTEMTIYINLEPPDPYAGLVTHRPDGTPIKPSYDSRPKKPFSGYLELDHAGIDAKTKFWEIREQVDPNINLHCSWEDCAHPDGSFNDTADLFMRLNRGDEYGELYELAIGGQAESLKAALRSKK